MNLKEVFRTEAEDRLWHLISKSMTYDDAGKLWNELVENQKKAEIIDELGKEWYDVIQYIRNSKTQRGKYMGENLLLTEENKRLTEVVETATGHVLLTRCHYEKIRETNPRLADEYLDHIRLCNGLLKELLTTKGEESK